MAHVTLHVLRSCRLNGLTVPLGLSAVRRPVNAQWCSSIRRNLGTTMSYSTIERGAPNSTDYRMYFRNDICPISPMHDIPLYADEANKIFHMIVEVPRWTNAKMEINLKETLNPIKQDVKKGKLRFVANCFPHHGYIWNYGALPQTWENPEVLDEATGCKGDNDPIDVLEIGYKVAKRGEVLKVKVLGAIALLDEGETDWKIIAVDINDPLAEQMNSVADVEKHYPGLMKATIEWFKIYKIPDGKPENQFAFNGEAKSKEFALKIIDDVHRHWSSLIKRDAPAGNIACTNVTVDGSPFKITPTAAEEVVEKAPERVEPHPVEPIVDKWHYVHLK
ncbi:inorganic pyrophosphatase [Orussus abietinus]|uniref:inorganic pyrophosphatase n=1 Tax=Orussus abietinus TaxID=222816 RepID=UPI000626B2CC|nr:inorganic pyrophosphatase [Orussus abietinus]